MTGMGFGKKRKFDVQATWKVLQLDVLLETEAAAASRTWELCFFLLRQYQLQVQDNDRPCYPRVSKQPSILPFVNRPEKRKMKRKATTNAQRK